MLPLAAYHNAMALHKLAIARAAGPMAETTARTRYTRCLAHARAAYPHHAFTQPTS